MNEFTFLSTDQIYGNDQLDILKIYGTKCAATDFSLLLGGDVNTDEYTSEGDSIKNRSSLWWTKNVSDDTKRGYGLVKFIATDGYSNWIYGCSRDIGARPAVAYSAIKNQITNEVREANGILEVEYGEYPQTVVSESFSEILENSYLNKTIKQTGKVYTTDSAGFQDEETPFTPINHIEYEYNGIKYIRFEVKSKCSGQILSDGRTVEEGKVYWVKVEPVRWMVDEKTDIALSKQILFSGIQFDRKENWNFVVDRFAKSEIKKFMDKHFARDIIPSKVILNNVKEDEMSRNSLMSKKRVNPYGFNFCQVSEEDIIRGALKSNTAVFLHGRSSEGKSARVKQFDPDCEIIYLRNATPESLNGKSILNPPIYHIDPKTNLPIMIKEGQLIDVKPTWLVNLERKCQEEPDKIHIVFFDEITNALPSIQGMAFNIVLDGEVNGKWKIPENARIVAAGNDLEDSLAANQMAEPLFNRFAHVYINTTVNSWLKWAVTPTEQYERIDYEKIKKTAKIHPAVYAYIASKSCIGQNVLRTKYNGKTPNADPRKWEMASKMLYATGQPEMLRALIGEDLTRDFVNFCKQKVITVEDVLNGNYSEHDLKIDLGGKFATAVSLSSVDESNLVTVRNFVKLLGEETCAAFETLWAHGDERRLEIIAELKMQETTQRGVVR